MDFFASSSCPPHLECELNDLSQKSQGSDTEQPLPVAHAITIQDVRIDFPVKPYPAQLQMMNKIIMALNNGQNALLESPTGSGKSLALLCSVLAWKEQQSNLLLKKIRSENEIILKDFAQNDDHQQAIVKQFVQEISEEEENDKPTRTNSIYVASRTHKQLSQLISELRGKTQYRPRMAVLGSRDHLCIHKKLRNATNKTEECRKLLDENNCSYFRGTKRLIDKTNLHSEIWDIEDIVKEGKKWRGCPYYASRTLFESAEVTFSPYNYIIDPSIRKVMEIDLRDSIIVLDEAHNIEDASRSAGSLDLTEEEFNVLLSELNLVSQYSGLPEPHNILQKMVGSLANLALSSNINYEKKERDQHSSHFTGRALLEKLSSAGITNDMLCYTYFPAFRQVEAHTERTRSQREKLEIEILEQQDSQTPLGQETTRRVYVSCLSAGSLALLQKIFLVLGFIFDHEHNYADSYELILLKKVKARSYGYKRQRTIIEADETDENGWAQKLGFWCLDPSVIFKNMCHDTHSVILTSGTLSPLNTFASELGTEFEGTLEANHVITPEQVWVRAIPYGPTHHSLKGIYQNVDSHQYQDEAGQAICEIVNTVPYGVLCFMPSYKAIDMLMARWKTTGILSAIEKRKLVLTEPRRKTKAVFERVLNRFYENIRAVEKNESNDNLDGVIMFAVFRGKVSEGIDFSDNNCRAVVALGIPYPSFMELEVILKKDYNDRKQRNHIGQNTLSGGAWYSAQAFRAINQALGRCIRHKNDWGAIILLEERFTKNSNVNGLSKWVKGYFHVEHHYQAGMESLKYFIDKRLSDEEKHYLEDRRTRIIVSSSEESELDSDTSMYEASINDDDSSSVDDSPPNINSSNDNTIEDNPSVDAIDSSISVKVEEELSVKVEEELSVKVEEELSVKVEEELAVIVKEGFDNDKSGTVNSQDEINAKEDYERLVKNMKNVTESKPSLAHASVSISAPISSETISFLGSSSVNDNIDTLIMCITCNKELLQGPTLAVSHGLTKLTCSLFDGDTIMTLSNIGTWVTSDYWVNGDLDIMNLPRLSDVVYDREEEICYKVLTCKCKESIGLVVCAATSDKNKSRVGDVYLLESKVFRKWKSMFDVTKELQDDSSDELDQLAAEILQDYQY